MESVFAVLLELSIPIKKKKRNPKMDKLDWLLVVKMPFFFLDKMESRAQPDWHWTVGTLTGGGHS